MILGPINPLQINFKKNFKKTLWPLFMDEVQLHQGYSHFEEAVYFLPFSSQKFLVLILSTSKQQNQQNHQNLIDSQSKVVKQSAYTTTSLGSDFLKDVAFPASFYNFVSIFLQLTLSGFLRVRASFVGSLVSIILSEDHLLW